MVGLGLVHAAIQFTEAGKAVADRMVGNTPEARKRGEEQDRQDRDALQTRLNAEKTRAEIAKANEIERRTSQEEKQIKLLMYNLDNVEEQRSKLQELAASSPDAKRLLEIYENTRKRFSDQTDNASAQAVVKDPRKVLDEVVRNEGNGKQLAAAKERLPELTAIAEGTTLALESMQSEIARIELRDGRLPDGFKEIKAKTQLALQALRYSHTQLKGMANAVEMPGTKVREEVNAEVVPLKWEKSANQNN